MDFTELRGRRKIYTSLSADSVENIKRILVSALSIHSKNVEEIEYLLEYTKGNQEILEREKNVRVDINNTIVINNAYSIARTFAGYFLGEPIQYVAKRNAADVQEAVQELNGYFDSECKHFVDKEIYNYVSICGIGYKGTFANQYYAGNGKTVEIERDEIPFVQVCLDPRNTFEVLSTQLGNRPALTCTYYDSSRIVDGENKNFTTFLVYTDNEQFTFETSKGVAEITFDDLAVVPYIDKDSMAIEALPTLYKTNPIQSYYSDNFLMGKFEHVIGLMEAINKLESNCLDDIEQVVQSILIFFGIDQEQHDEVQKVGTGDVICFSGQQGINQDGKFISASINSESSRELRESLKEELKEKVGIPDRKTRGGGGGDTMGAVKLRDGWADIEVIARNDETFWTKAEKQSLKVVLSILNNNGLLKELKAGDVAVKFSRNKNDDMLTKAEVSKILYDIGVPLNEIVKFTGISTDIMEFSKSWAENLANRAVEEKKNQTFGDTGTANGEV